MIIEKSTNKPLTQFRGRPNIYPFGELKPGFHLIIDHLPDGIEKHRHRIKSALYQYKKWNALLWQTAIRVEDNKIVVYRIK